MADLQGWEEVEESGEDEVELRLHALGLDGELLRNAIRTGHERAAWVTGSHPRTFRGTVVWGEATAALRESCALRGWANCDKDNIAKAISGDGQNTVVVVSGDSQTGRRHGGISHTRRPRGNAGVRLVLRNNQLELSALLPAHERLAEAVPPSNTGATWLLLYHCVGRTVRLELSRASAVSADGAIAAWAERLILPDVDLDEPLAGAPDFDAPLSTPSVPVRIVRRT